MDMDEAQRIVEALAEKDPLYDRIHCFFCYSYPPDLMEGGAHEEDCPWWRARKLLGMPPWPS